MEGSGGCRGLVSVVTEAVLLNVISDVTDGIVAQIQCNISLAMVSIYSHAVFIIISTL